eukprot:1937013-Rhodomonas_salina.2
MRSTTTTPEGHAATYQRARGCSLSIASACSRREFQVGVKRHAKDGCQDCYFQSTAGCGCIRIGLCTH